jgi:hypothetical protein
MSLNHIRLYNLFRRELYLTDEKAGEAVFAVQEMTESTMDSKKDALATKEDIYLSGILQFIAMTGTLLAIIKLFK